VNFRGAAPPGGRLVEDRWRVAPRSVWTDQAQHEWQHFIVFTEVGTLILNFSRELDSYGRECGRLIVLLQGVRWETVLETYSRPRFSSDGMRAAFGDSNLTINSVGWRVAISIPERDVEIRLDVRPASDRLAARNRRVSESARLEWLLYPNVVARGTLRIGDVDTVVDGATGYHDHNWGDFSWGDDFGWEWGSIPAGDDGRLAVVCSALTNLTGSVRRLQQLFVWVDGKHRWTGRGPEVDRTPGPAWPKGKVPRIPGVMSMVTPAAACRAPSRSLTFEGSTDERAASVEVEFDHRCEILIPDERRPCGTVVLNECVGTARVRWQDGESVLEHEGPAVFEMLYGAGHPH